jgi:hypothetical protein
LVGFEAAVVERVDRPKFESISKKKRVLTESVYAPGSSQFYPHGVTHQKSTAYSEFA